MPDQLRTTRRPVRPIRASRLAVALLGAALLALALAACSALSSPSARGTITFLVRNETGQVATYRFDGSAEATGVGGPLGCLARTTIVTTWDPTWTFAVNGRPTIASSDSSDLQPEADARDGLTVIVVIDVSGVQTTAHAGPPLAAEADPPGPSAASQPACLPAPS